MTKDELYRCIVTMRNELNIKYNDYPINMLKVIKNLNQITLECVSFNNPGLCGIFLRGDDHHTIVVNKNHSWREQNFNCTHELMHVYFDNQMTKVAFFIDSGLESFRKKQNPFAEWRANEGAAELLVPYKLFILDVAEKFKENAFNQIEKNIKLLALKYNVTPAVIEYRINCLEYEISQYMQGVPLDEIEICSKSTLNKRKIKCANVLGNYKNKRARKKL